MARWTRCAHPASGLRGIPGRGSTGRCLGSRVPPNIDRDRAAYQRFCPSGTASATAWKTRGSPRRGLPPDPVRRITQFVVACRACRAVVNGTAATLRTRFRPRFRPLGTPDPGDTGNFSCCQLSPPTSPTRSADPTPPGPCGRDPEHPEPATPQVSLNSSPFIAGHRAQPRACMTGPSKQNAVSDTIQRCRTCGSVRRLSC